MPPWGCRKGGIAGGAGALTRAAGQSAPQLLPTGPGAKAAPGVRKDHGLEVTGNLLSLSQPGSRASFPRPLHT